MMPTSLKKGQAFLTALTRYVDFRLTDKGQTAVTPKDHQVYVSRFEAFVKSRPGAKSHPEMCKKLVEKMSMLKTARGTATLRPDSQSPGD